MKMTETEMRELDAWIAENVMGWLVLPNGMMHGKEQIVFCDSKTGHSIHSLNCGCNEDFNPTANPAAAMEALMAYYKIDPNDVLPALHNFLIRKEFTERTMTPEKVCLFIKEHFERYHK